MRRFRATLAYDGTAYFGYQRQPDVPTVQERVEQALSKILQTPTTVHAAGRTDTGVHATGQVIAFDALWKHDASTLLRAINAKLPDDIALQDIAEQADFHPRFDALSRTYRYDLAVLDVRQPLLAKRAWQMQSDLDERVLQQTARMLTGEHDFAAFGKPPQGTNTVRVVYESAWQIGTALPGISHSYSVTATAFLHHMVRRMVGMQVAAARGEISLAQFEDIFKSAHLARNHWIAPPQGLTFVEVRYPQPANNERLLQASTIDQ